MTLEQSPGRRFAVIGGGITGLAAAHRLIELGQQCQQPVDVTLLEGSDRVGGVAGTTRVGQYLVETGADNFITNKPAAVKLCERLGIADQLLKTETKYRGSLVLKDGRPMPVPEGFMLLSPAKVWPVLKSPIFSWAGKLRMGLELFVPRRTDDVDESLADFVRRRLGREALDRLIQPLVGGIYTSDPERLSLKATLPRFIDMERECGSLIRASRRQAARESRQSSESSGGGARYSLFAAPREGMSVIFDTLRERIAARGQVVLKTPVMGLQQLESGRVRLLLADQRTADFDGVLIALPAFRQAALLKTLNPAPATSDLEDLCRELSAIEYASTAVVVSGHRLDDIKHPLDSFGLVIPAIEKRRVLAVSFSSRKFVGRAPAGRVILRTFVGGAMQPEELQNSDEQLERIVSDELRSILGVKGTPDFMAVVRHNNSMPQYYLGHLERIANIARLSAGLPGIVLAGNAFQGVGLPDCIDNAEAAAERLMNEHRSSSECLTRPS